MDINYSLLNLMKIKKELLKEINKLHFRYMRKHLSAITIDNMEDYELDAKSYTILCHAALENFIESIAEILIKHAMHIFIYDKKVSSILLSFCIFKDIDIKDADDNGWKSDIRSLVKTPLEDAVNTFTNYLNQSNHGIKVKNLKEILRPVGIDIKSSQPLITSLEYFTNLRGKFAHRFMEKGSYARVSRPEGPEAICNAVMDVITLFTLVHISSIKLLDLDSVKKDVFEQVFVGDLLKNFKSTAAFTGTLPLKAIA